jgi:hypothetical protein
MPERKHKRKPVGQWNARREGRWRIWKSTTRTLFQPPLWYWGVQFTNYKADADEPHEWGTATWAWLARRRALRALKEGGR